MVLKRLEKVISSMSWDEVVNYLRVKDLSDIEYEFICERLEKWCWLPVIDKEVYDDNPWISLPQN